MKKNGMRISMTGLLFALLLPLQVCAEGSGDGFRLDQSGTVTLDSSHAAKEGISSCCFSLTVEPENGNHVEFVFAGELAEIMEYRYNADERKLNIYMAGTDALFPEGTESLAIGKVVVTDGSGKNGKATVSVDEGSLQFVYGSEARIMEDVDMPEAVKIDQTGDPGTITPPTPTATPAPVVTPSPTTPPAPIGTLAPAAPSAPSNPAGSAPVGSQPGGTQTAGNQGGNGQSSSAPVRKPAGTQVGSTQGTGGSQVSGNQGTGSSQESSSAQESEPKVENSAQPSQESPSESVESGEEEMASASAESREEEENLSKGEGSFWKELKPVLTGLGIGALLLGIGAVVVMLLIKAPKRK